MSGLTSLGKSIVSNKTLEWEQGIEQKKRTAKSMIQGKKNKVKATLAKFNVTSKEIIKWTTNNNAANSQISKEAGNGEYETLKLIIKKIVKCRARNNMRKED